MHLVKGTAATFNSDFYLAIDTIVPIVLLGAALVIPLAKILAKVSQPPPAGTMVKRFFDVVSRGVRVLVIGIPFVILYVTAATACIVISTLALILRETDSLLSWITFGLFMFVLVATAVAILCAIIKELVAAVRPGRG